MTRKYFGRLLIADSDSVFIKYIKDAFEIEGFFCDICTSLNHTKSLLNKYSYDAILLDLFFKQNSSLLLMSEIIKQQPFSKVFILSSTFDTHFACKSLSLGASDFLEKTNIQHLIERVKIRLLKHSKKIHPEAQKLQTLTGIIGNSDMTRDILDQIAKLKDIHSTVLILGESGSGKELIARALHTLSKRRHKTFEAINCGAMPDQLIESELFGYKRGAFTDAKQDKKGLFEICNEGTLFLDEVGEMPLSFQVKLLRILQEKELRPLGSIHSIKINTRIIVATNKDLLHEVKQKTFREDLYYRLSVFMINVPPLRSRKADIKDLIQHYINKFSLQYQKNIAPLSQEIMARLTHYNWPGNVRELKHSIERAVVMADSDQINLEDLMIFHPYKKLSIVNRSSTLYSEAKELFEKNYLQNLLEQARGNVSEAARLSGRFRSDIYRMMKRYHIKDTFL